MNSVIAIPRIAAIKIWEGLSVKRIRWSLLTTIVCIGTWIVFASAISCDVAWNLYVAEQVCEGERLFVDLCTLSTPLIVWFCCLPHIMAVISQTPNDVAFHGTVLGLCVTSLHMCSQAIYTLTRGLPAERILLETLVAVLFLFGAGYHFGEIEHLLFVCVLPYIFMIAIRIRNLQVSNGFSCGVGLLAALGICFDSRFAVVWIATAFILTMRNQTRVAFRLESFVVATGMICFAACVMLFAPEYFAQLQLPTHWDVSVWTIQLLRGFLHPAFYFIGLLFVLTLLLTKKNELLSLQACLAATSVIFWLTAAVRTEQIAFAYYPSLATALLSATLISLRLCREPTRRQFLSFEMAIAASVPIAFVLCILSAQVFELPEHLDFSSDSDELVVPMNRILKDESTSGPILSFNCLHQFRFGAGVTI